MPMIPNCKDHLQLQKQKKKMMMIIMMNFLCVAMNIQFVQVEVSLCFRVSSLFSEFFASSKSSPSALSSPSSFCVFFYVSLSSQLSFAVTFPLLCLSAVPYSCTSSCGFSFLFIFPVCSFFLVAYIIPLSLSQPASWIAYVTSTFVTETQQIGYSVQFIYKYYWELIMSVGIFYLFFLGVLFLLPIFLGRSLVVYVLEIS